MATGEPAPRGGTNRWAEMDPARRRRWAFALAAEGTVVFALSAWGLAAVVDDDGAVWACAAIAAVWFAAFMVCIALRPTAARRFGLLSLIPLALAPIVLAYVASR
jgi:hypothetical protein